MRACFFAMATLGGVLVAEEGALVAQQGESRARGAHYEVVCHFSKPKVAQRTLAVVEATWPVAMRLYGVSLKPLREPLAVHLYRDANAYVEAEARLTGGRFRRNLAFAHFATKTAHVALQPDLSDEVLDRVGPSFQTLRLLVHEAAHLARYSAIRNYRSHPGWFADGNATWIEERVLTAMGVMSGIEEDPSFCAKISHVQKLVAKDALPSISQILHDDTEALAFFERYSVRWLFFRFLREEHEPLLRHVIVRMKRFGGGGQFAARVAAALERKIGAEALADLDQQFEQYIAQLSPVWDEMSRSLHASGEDWVQTAFENSDAIAWRR